MAARPRKVTVRTYQVGFGDCFLLTFHYAKGERHVLVDFGSTRLPGRPTAKGKKAGSGDKYMARVADDIKQRVGKNLVAVIATHRHKDHISGFATKDGTASGDIIRSCKPKLVLMPWTEQPDLARNATAPGPTGAAKGFVQGLLQMHDVAQNALEVLKVARGQFGPSHLKEIEFIADDNLANLSAVKNLTSMGKPLYLYYGKRPSALERLLPGVKIDVLGPPTLKQTESIKTQAARDPDEFWHLQSLASARASLNKKKLFGRHASYASIPPDARWLCDRIDRLGSNQLLGIVRALDKAMNNTSLILLFNVGKKRLLFPGDAQIETWRHALLEAKDAKANQKKLATTDFYKVGHHGSLNATPHTLWDLFEKRKSNRPTTKLKSVVSTLPGVHGNSARKTEVPRRTLLEALSHDSDLTNTHEFARGTLSEDVEIPL
jgi:hypothetical protein